MLKLLHIADVHLDTTFLNRSEVVRQTLKAAIRTAFARAVDVAIEETVDAVLIAGDLFDGSRLSFSTERFLIEQLQRLDGAGIPCFYATGNHDPAGDDSRLKRMGLPASFTSFDRDKPKVIDLAKEGKVVARVVGAGHESDAVTKNLAARFPAAAADIPTIGLLHALVTSASGMDRHGKYAPCTVEDLRSKGYAYWALGHVHERQQVDGEGRIYYSGNIQGRTPKETGARGGLLLTIDGSDVNATFVPLHAVEWIDLEIDGLEDVSDASKLEQRVRQRFIEDVAARSGPNGSAGSNGSNHHGRQTGHTIRDLMVRVILTGPTPLATELLREEYLNDIAADLKSSLGTLDLEVTCRNTRPPVDIDEYRNGQHLLGEVLALIDETAEDDDLIQELAPEPIADVTSSAEDRVAYLRSLLDEMDTEAAARLLVEEG